MKSLMLLNPRRKSRKTRKASRKARRRTRRTVAAAPAPKRRRVRRSRKARKSQVFKGRGSSVMLRVNPRKRSFRRGRRSGGSGSIMGMVKELGSKETLMIAGGAIGATAITTIVTSRWGSKLPGATSTMGNAAYVVGIPLVAAFIVRRWSPALAKGLIIGAAAQGINALAGSAISSAVAKVSGTGEYLSAPRPVGEYLTRNRVGGVSYDGMKAFGVGAQTPHSDNAYMRNDNAFRASAWETPSF